MQCERCKKRKASVFYKENINGCVKEFQLCHDCATLLMQAGELEDMSMLLENFHSPLSIEECEDIWTLWTMLPPNTSHTSDEAKTCPACGCSLDNLKRTGKVGCSECYTAFADEMTTYLRSVHGGVIHRGRHPKAYRKKKEIQEKIAQLKKRLSVAVSAEAYEQAAKIRDEIKALEGGL